ncbi:MAG: MaoC family dehydratase N-terminal domain-containing protein [Candidatus Tectomicrobia bacterium]|uniref:MaoC family dehydratase N-terminal domain-containing protein n=1 Tax=Tectimicrobiota bacterium TaxID=2528274 RepID=A0A932CNJ2_UNCTE|nr:MaoC family dehydratase N-terminal domain-containing protein [Candidatus Tectomicrobia bacterium]
MEPRHARITEEELERLRQRMGIEIPHRPSYIEEISRDAIRHFAYGLGDLNPLWTDEEYAQKTRYGGLVAPPCILYSTSLIASGAMGGLPGVHAMFSGTDWEWFLPLRAGDRIRSTSRLSQLDEKSSEFARRTILQGYETRFTNQQGEQVARATSFCLRAERDTAREKGKYSTITRQSYTEAEIQAIEAGYDREEVRGSRPRYWEEVTVGEKLTPLVKGPLTVTDMVAWLMGWGGIFLRAHRIGLEFRRKHPGAASRDAYGVPDVPERVHWDSDFAREVGVPGAYDYGPQRISWMGQLMTHWIGDDGFLQRLNVQVRRFNIVGDTTWCKGRVIDKQCSGKDHWVVCEVWAENQRGEVTVKGEATALLPTKLGD